MNPGLRCRSYSKATLEPCFRVVITTYDRLRAEYRNRQISGTVAPLVDMDWYRVVLGELSSAGYAKTAIS